MLSVWRNEVHFATKQEPECPWSTREEIWASCIVRSALHAKRLLCTAASVCGSSATGGAVRCSYEDTGSASMRRTSQAMTTEDDWQPENLPGLAKEAALASALIKTSAALDQFKQVVCCRFFTLTALENASLLVKCGKIMDETHCTLLPVIYSGQG